MADPTGNDPKPTENKTGPVKPPVLDLKPNESATSKPESKVDAKPEAKLGAKPEAPLSSKPETKAEAKFTPPKEALTRPKPVTPEKADGGFAIGAAVTGGVLGLAAAYGLAWAGLWPAAPAPAAETDPRIAQFATAIPELETVTQTTQSELATLNQRIGALETAEPAEQTATAATPTAEPTDLSGIESEIAALTSRLETLSATPAPEADTADVDGLRTDLASLGTRLDEIAARLGTAEADLRTLDTTMTETTATLAEQPGDIGAVLQLPLILSGFETAFATGRPYATELAALRAAAPSAAIPTAIANKADAGLTRPDVIASRFATALPAMLAGRPANPDAQWQDGALDWFRSAIALRPAGEIEGDDPEAVMTRLDGAIARRDFVEAQSLLAALPPAMLAAVGDVPALIAEQAEATQFLDQLRSSALSGEVAQ